MNCSGGTLAPLPASVHPHSTLSEAVKIAAREGAVRANLRRPHPGPTSRSKRKAVAMTTAQLDLTNRQGDEGERVAHWRFETLRCAGYGRRSARTLARRRDVDLHLAADLLRAGCPVETALQILL